MQAKEGKFTVYVLLDRDGKLYKGMTISLPRRLAEHRSGKTQTTARMTDIRLVYTEEHSNRQEARRRELYLKSAAGRRFLAKRLKGRSSRLR